MRAQQNTEMMMHKQEILYVDDERGVREGWRRFLSAEDRMVTTASDGDSAIRGLMGHPVDLVISDLRMPGADGLELLEWIHDHEPETRFVLVTGYGSPEVEEKARRLGAFGYLEKPVSPDELEGIALAALRGEQSSWAHAVVADDPALTIELPEPSAPPVLELVTAEEEVAAVETVADVQPDTLRNLGRLMMAPLVGFAYIMFLPVIGIAAAVYGIGMISVKALRPVMEYGVETFSDIFGEASTEPDVEPTVVEPGTLRDLGRLMTAPLIGFAYIMFLPVIGIAAAVYGIGMVLVKPFRTAVETGIEPCSVVFEEESIEPAVETTTFEAGSLRDLGRLVAAPFKGLAYLLCMPVIVLSTVAYGLGAKTVRVFRPANVR